MTDSLTDKAGNVYRVVPSLWLKALVIFSGVNFILLIFILAGLIDNIRSVNDTVRFTDKVSQRNMALGDVAEGRARANIWAFNKTCELVEKLGQKCLDDPKWYADPDKYPLIVDDVMGVGLFPPKTK